MYYEEKLIHGVMHWRSNPNDKFVTYTIQELSERYASLKEELHRAQTSMASLKDA